MGSNSRFKRGSGVYKCEHCGRRTRDTDGECGSFGLCRECDQGLMQENGYSDTSDPVVKAQYRKDADAFFQAAVNKGGTIEGFTRA